MARWPRDQPRLVRDGDGQGGRCPTLPASRLMMVPDLAGEQVEGGLVVLFMRGLAHQLWPPRAGEHDSLGGAGHRSYLMAPRVESTAGA